MTQEEWDAIVADNADKRDKAEKLRRMYGKTGTGVWAAGDYDENQAIADFCSSAGFQSFAQS